MKTRWNTVPSIESTSKDDVHCPLNILVVPFPYCVLGTAFGASQDLDPGRDGYFELRQHWLPGKKGWADLIDFVSGLIRAAEQQVGCIHEIVFPEASLTTQLAIALARGLARRHKRLECLIAGAGGSRVKGKRQVPRNCALTIELRDGRVSAFVEQEKHHRWKVDDSQIRTYGLAHALDPSRSWWEDIDVGERSLEFFLNERNWVRAVLVCEDLARFDPVLPVLNAIGPNLVVALLMDGPQLVDRWPARYATVLSEDPGSSVLTVTSIGMVARSRCPGRLPSRSVGLWKDSSGPAIELNLPENAHGLILTVTQEFFDQRTLDRRSDAGASIRLRLSGVCPVRHPRPPAWSCP